MTGSLRQHLRAAIDARTRELLADAGEPTCARCGCPQQLRTIGCRSCQNRHWRRRTRAAA